MPANELPELDRSAPLPLYAQLRDALQRRIREGGLRPGDRFPTEVELQARYGVSRATIRQALSELENAGAIRRVQGLGTFVAATKIRHVPLLTSFAELAASQGFTPSHRVLATYIEEPPPEVGHELGLAAGAECRYLRRLLLADESPVGLAETWLPADALAGGDELLARLDRESLYEVLQREPISLSLERALETVSPGVVDAGNARLLHVDPGSPVLLIRRLTFTTGGRAVEATHLVFVGERYEYRVELSR